MNRRDFIKGMVAAGVAAAVFRKPRVVAEERVVSLVGNFSVAVHYTETNAQLIARIRERLEELKEQFDRHTNTTPSTLSDREMNLVCSEVMKLPGVVRAECSTWREVVRV